VVVIVNMGDYWIEHVIQPRVSVPFGARSLLNQVITKPGRVMSIQAVVDGAGSFVDSQVSINVHQIGGATISIGTFLSDFQIAMNNHGTANASVGAHITLILRKG